MENRAQACPRRSSSVFDRSSQTAYDKRSKTDEELRLPGIPRYRRRMTLPPPLSDWFTSQGWHLHPHQVEMLARGSARSTLLIAPTGGGKTLAGFLPSLTELANGHDGLHTLYISPLKALAADIRRNLRRPVEGAGLPIRIEDRTGDTSQTQRRRQRADPPHILLTTPESLALLLPYEDAPRIFADLQRVGVEDPPALATYLGAGTEILLADPGPDPDIAMLDTVTPPPWAGAGGRYAIPEVLNQITRHQTTLIFHNTRAQAEIFFHHLWLANSEDLPIGIYHGSLSREQRERVESATASGALRAVIGGEQPFEVSGHFHPKARLAGKSYRAFLVDENRVILPAYGTFTGGLWAEDHALQALFGPRARAILTLPDRCLAIPLPRVRPRRS